ncbi:MAG: hypothetical protein AAGD23_00920 [Pseudomonadota bacterium]
MSSAWYPDEAHGTISIVGASDSTLRRVLIACWRIIGLSVMVIMVVAAVSLYGFKHEAQDRRAHIADLRVDIAEEREKIALAEAEWTTLNDPARIQALAEQFLELEPMAPDQTIAMSEVPMRPQPEGPASISELIETHLLPRLSE